MKATDETINLKEILYLTDSSPACRQALLFATTLARHYNATVRALHLVVANRGICCGSKLSTGRIEAEPETVQSTMSRLDSETPGIKHQQKLLIREETSIWPAVEDAVECYHSDLIVLGSYGQPNLATSRFGSTAEEILRRSTVPVLTVGPRVSCGTSTDGRFHRVLAATNFEAESNRAVKYAQAIAEGDRGQLLLMHVISRKERNAGVPSVAETMHRLYELLPRSEETRFCSEGIVRFGDPSRWIIETAKDRCADLIVMGARDDAADLKFGSTTAHRVVARAPCPVLTVRKSVPGEEKTAEGMYVN